MGKPTDDDAKMRRAEEQLAKTLSNLRRRATVEAVLHFAEQVEKLAVSLRARSEFDGHPRSTNGPLWKSDKTLAADFHAAVGEFRAHPAFWPNDGSMNRNWDEVDEFLENIEGREYDDLSIGQKNLLGTIRRTHMAWAKGKNK